MDVFLFIRDDGSSDDTVDKIKKLQVKYSGKILLEEGINKGYKISFMYLLAHAPKGYDYYAFSDQDDVWLKEKLFVATDKLRKERGPAAYCSKPIYVDNKLNKINGIYSNLDELPTGIIKLEWALATGLIALGCTFVWNSSLQMIIQSTSIEGCEFAHDGFISMLAPSVGVLVKDDKGYVLYRQHHGNTSGPKKRKKYSIKSMFRNLFTSKDKFDHDYAVRSFILNHYNSYINTKKLELLRMSVAYRRSIFTEIKLLKKNFANGLNGKERTKFRYEVLTRKF